MTREELLQEVGKKVNISSFKSLSQRTIDEELDDVLGDFGDDDAANDAIVTKLANRLKRMDGNLHFSVSQEIKRAQEEMSRKNADKRVDDKEVIEDKGNHLDTQVQALLDRIAKLETDAKERDARESKDKTLASVREGLKAKFGQSNIPMNDFFANIALSKLDIEESDTVGSLVMKAETIYTSDMKAAGLIPDTKPRKGDQGGGNDRIDERMWDDIASRMG